MLRTTDRLQQVLQKPERLMLGLMSGMSMDGVDLAFARIHGSYPALQIDLLDSDYYPYAKAFREKLLAACHGSVADVCRLNVEVAEIFSQSVNSFIETRGLQASEIDAIGSHGQTLAHFAPELGTQGSTLQLGSLSVIAERTDIVTVGNFRQRDMAQGGQGAPLVPLLDWLLYANKSRTLAVHNLGSISNLSVIGEKREDVVAFDTGPANLGLDFFARRIPNNNDLIDRDGKISASGTVCKPLLEQWLQHPFFALLPPKSAGYEEFSESFWLQAHQQHLKPSIEDCVRTALELCVETLARAYERFVLPKKPELKEIVFSGGGAHNPTLMTRIAERLPAIHCRNLLEEDPKFCDAKEALAFAVLANETLSGRAGNLPTVTGASKAVILGEIAL